jgi:hypothetical protein
VLMRSNRIESWGFLGRGARFLLVTSLSYVMGVTVSGAVPP